MQSKLSTLLPMLIYSKPHTCGCWLRIDFIALICFLNMKFSFCFRKKKTKGKKGKKDSSSSGSGSDNDVEVIKVWNSRSRGGGEGNVDETGNNPSGSVKLEESECNECCLSCGTLT